MSEFDAVELLCQHGLRITQQRVAVATLLFADGEDKHVSAEWITAKLGEAGEHVACATVYNTLHSFVDAGLMREVHGAEAGVIIYDTNTTPHHHFFDETTKSLIDIPADSIKLLGLPAAPKGKTTVGWDIIVRVR